MFIYYKISNRFVSIQLQIKLKRYFLNLEKLKAQLLSLFNPNTETQIRNNTARKILNENQYRVSPTRNERVTPLFSRKCGKKAGIEFHSPRRGKRSY